MYRPYFCEEPVPPENIDALAEVCRAVRVPIATGERLATRHQFREVLEKRAAHVIQPDLCHCGGRGAAQSAGADRQCGGAALRARDAEFPDPGRYAGGRAVALGGGGEFAFY
jgi:galactonate dehydratase